MRLNLEELETVPDEMLHLKAMARGEHVTAGQHGNLYRVISFGDRDSWLWEKGTFLAFGEHLSGSPPHPSWAERVIRNVGQEALVETLVHANGDEDG